MEPKTRKKKIGIHKFLEKDEKVKGLGNSIIPKIPKTKKIEEEFWVPVKYKSGYGRDAGFYQEISEGTIQVNYSATYCDWGKTNKNPLMENVDFELNEEKFHYPQFEQKLGLPKKVIESFAEYLPDYVLNIIPETKKYLYEKATGKKMYLYE